MTHHLAGRKQSAEHIAKRTAAIRATGVYERTRALTIERNRARRGEKHTPEHIEKRVSGFRGKPRKSSAPLSIEHRRKLSEYWTGNPKHNHYIDGKSAERTSARTVAMGRLEYRLWRAAVFQRDNYTCVACGVRGGQLQADHIKPYALYPELRTSIENGQTLCKKCHLLTPTHGVRSRPRRAELPI